MPSNEISIFVFADAETVDLAVHRLVRAGVPRDHIAIHRWPERYCLRISQALDRELGVELLELSEREFLAQTDLERRGIRGRRTPIGRAPHGWRSASP